MKIEFTIPITPMAQKRARARAIKLPNGHVTAMAYKDKGQRIAEDNFRSLLYEHRPDSQLTGPLKLLIIADLPIPASKSKKWKQQAADGLIFPDKKPDVDNLAKHVKDCMQGIFYQDDKQIVGLEIWKYYSDSPKWFIGLYEITGA